MAEKAEEWAGKMEWMSRKDGQVEVERGTLQKRIGCFNHRVVTLVADNLSCGYESFTLVLETNWRRQPEKQVPNVQATLLSPSYTTLKPSEDLKGSLYKCTSELQ